ncbi:cbb3-type cytochrome c oxidase subunit 3 [Poseidonocella sedimentorum]|uniref:Cytochrome c oxidase cbb3-type subunit 4 n=1 Tax=Poseidonocella sedimentorum TaxID=871652 RepID=A0A1I6DV88_9RHOB|nr:cbb3-type cytochrome c oxidase subunit 3 [Poseidonocella sedimentorum]SFR09251.1 cytochrome c oxidase cbb3-type subunit 4 [Poseidonocella sedimentorum]
MDTYSLLREFADSWVLLGMVLFFLGVGLWAYWPSLRSDRDDASMIPFRNQSIANRDDE